MSDSLTVVVNGRSRRAQRQSDVVAAEFLKARTLRAQWLLWAAGVVGALVGTAAALVFASVLRSLEAEIPPEEIEALLGRASVAGAPTVALFLGFAAIHLFASERSSGRERQTALEVPSTMRVLYARLAVASATSLGVALVSYTVCAVVAAVVTTADGQGGIVLAAEGVLMILAVSLATSLVVHIAACIGAVVTQGVVAAGVFVTVFTVVPAALGSLSATPGNEVFGTVAGYFPAGRLGAVVEAMVAADARAAVAALGILALTAAAMTVCAHATWRARRGSRSGDTS